jgi:mitochondrial inner membrane protease ATP23
MLSGECSFKNELGRGHANYFKQFQKCIRRRAALSIAAHPDCQGLYGTQAINEVFDTCYKDREPFGRIPVI